MPNFITITVCMFLATVANTQNLYIKTFGDPNSKPIIYLHGGPGYNSVNFELTTAKKLADNNFYVIVYDRRSEGRSIDNTAKFTFQQTIDDLNYIYKTVKINKATILGHSFGGIIATKFAEKYPEKINSIVLVGAPVSMQETFATILKSSKAIYKAKNDSVNLKYISMLENMDKTSIEYSTYCFGHAMQNGFYAPKQIDPDAKAIYMQFRSDSLMKKYGSQMSYQAPQGFWSNEKYTSIDLSNNLKNIMLKGIKVYGLYGKDDGLYSAEQINGLSKIIGQTNTIYLDNCSHNVFIDQQMMFIEMIKKWIK